METLHLAVSGMTCGHCTAAVEREVGAVPGVVSAVADLGAGAVTVAGDSLDETAIRAAVAEAGYEAL